MSHDKENDKDSARNPVGRPADWYTKISAPEKAIQFYKLLSELADDPAFDICHVFSGATNGHVPVIRWEGRVKNIPSVAGAYLSLNTGRKKCDTHNCCNPLHYEKASSADFISKEKDKEFVPQVDAPTGADYAEVVEYEIDRGELPYPKPYQFADFRPHIHIQDLTDAQLQMALEHLNKQ